VIRSAQRAGAIPVEIEGHGADGQHADCELHDAVGMDPVPRTAEPRRGEGAADCETQQHGRQHRRERVARRGQDQHQDPEPDHLEREGGESGERERELAEPRDHGSGDDAGRDIRPRGDVRTPGARRVEGDGGHPDERVEQRCELEAPRDPDAADEHEPGDERAGDGARGIGGVDHADARPRERAIGQRRPHDERQRGAHEHRGGEQDGE
jgi:hypothetical protein